MARLRHHRLPRRRRLALRQRRRRSSRSSRGLGSGAGAAAHPAGTPDSASRAGAVRPDAARAREGSRRPVASEKSGGRRVRQKTCPRSATRSSGSRVRRKTRSPPRTTLRGRDANARATARAPKKDPFASSIAIATPEFDVARERRARGATFRGRRRGETGVVVRTGKKAGKWEAEELCLRPRTSSSAAAIVGAPPPETDERKSKYLHGYR